MYWGKCLWKINREEQEKVGRDSDHNAGGLRQLGPEGGLGKKSLRQSTVQEKLNQANRESLSQSHLLEESCSSQKWACITMLTMFSHWRGVQPRPSAATVMVPRGWLLEAIMLPMAGDVSSHWYGHHILPLVVVARKAESLAGSRQLQEQKLVVELDWLLWITKPRLAWLW